MKVKNAIFKQGEKIEDFSLNKIKQRIIKYAEEKDACGSQVKLFEETPNWQEAWIVIKDNLDWFISEDTPFRWLRMIAELFASKISYRHESPIGYGKYGEYNVIVLDFDTYDGQYEVYNYELNEWDWASVGDFRFTKKFKCKNGIRVFKQGMSTQVRGK